MRNGILLFIVHVVLLVLAATNSSVFSWVSSSWSFGIQYFSFSLKRGWGVPYVSDYGLGQVVCYIAGYALGAVAFGMWWTRYRLRAALVAAVFCVVGAASFSVEATHWWWSHHTSLIASFPIVLGLLWVGILLERLLYPDGQSVQTRITQLAARE
jgi:hypothetical protein